MKSRSLKSIDIREKCHTQLSSAVLVVLFIASFPVHAQTAPIDVKAARDTYILKERDQATFNDPLSITPPGDLITLIGYYADYFTVLHGNDTGYVYSLYIDGDTPGVAEFKRSHSAVYQQQLKDQESKRKAERLAESERLQPHKLKLLIKAFGNENGRRVYNKEVWIGMSDKMAKASIGSPESINTTITIGNVHEQWVYPQERYLYFDNGILTAIQESK